MKLVPGLLDLCIAQVDGVQHVALNVCSGRAY